MKDYNKVDFVISKPADLLNEEAYSVFLDSASLEVPDLVDRYTQAIRSSIVAGDLFRETDVFSDHTNCVGAVTRLNALFSPEYFATGMAWVRSYPWQTPKNQRETHIVSIVKDLSSEQIYYADPTPLSGYLYGTSGALEVDNERTGLYKYFDRALGGSVILQELTGEQVEAVIAAKVSRNSIDTQPDQAIALALKAIPLLEEVGSYRTIALSTLERLEYGGEGWVNSMANIESIKTSQLDLLNSERREEFDALIKVEDKQRRRVQKIAARLAASSTSLGELNYWSSVEITMRSGYGAIVHDALTRLSWKNFSDISQTPVKEYESYKKIHHGLCKSALYSYGWRVN